MQYAVQSQLQFHGHDPLSGVIQLKLKEGKETFETQDILSVIEQEGDSIALILLPGKKNSIYCLTCHKQACNIKRDNCSTFKP
jgi:hypothetical protein